MHMNEVTVEYYVVANLAEWDFRVVLKIVLHDCAWRFALEILH